MQYNVSFTEHNGILKVEVNSDRAGDPVGKARRVWSQVAEQCLTKGFYRILMVSRLKRSLGIFPAFELAHRPEVMGLHNSIRIAIVDLNELSREHNEFAALVANNRGWIVEVFASRTACIGSSN